MAAKVRVVFDTNIFISAIIFGGNPRVCLELARNKEIKLLTSKPILLELSKKLKEKFKWTEPEVAEIIEGIGKFTNIVEPKVKINVIKKDPKDNRILECAREGKADYIVSGDKKHILALHRFERIEILSAQEFLNLFYKKN